MSITEQQQVKQKYYGEATRYMYNAKESLKKAGINRITGIKMKNM